MKHNKTYKTNSQPPHQLNIPQMGPNGPIWTDAQKSTNFPDLFDFSGPYFFPATQKSYLPNFARNKKFFRENFFSKFSKISKIFQIFEKFSWTKISKFPRILKILGRPMDPQSDAFKKFSFFQKI